MRVANPSRKAGDPTLGGINVDIEAFRRQLIADCNDLLAPLGLRFQSIVFEIDQPRQSFWQRLKNEIAARPRVL